MDVHKETIVVAVTSAAETGKATAYGTFANTTASLRTLVERLRKAGAGPLKFCYEAGPCGYGVHRALTQLGEDCMVVAPSMIPRQSGQRQKTDKRDAANLAVLHRGGLLTAVWVPDTAHEAMRDLIRTRLAAVRAVRAARQQLSGFLLRHDRIYPPSKRAWTKAHRGWLAAQSFVQPAHQIVLAESIEAVRQGERRRDRVDALLRAQIPTWSLSPLVKNLCALRGVDVITGAGLAAAIGDPARFVTAEAFMAYLGLVPSEHTSGPRRRMGAITKHALGLDPRGRGRPRPHRADRSGAQLPAFGPCRPRQTGRRGIRARCGARHRLESAGPLVPALSPDDGGGQAETGRGHGHRPRAGGVRLGYRLRHLGPARRERDRATGG
jgi:transposase